MDTEDIVIYWIRKDNDEKNGSLIILREISKVLLDYTIANIFELKCDKKRKKHKNIKNKSEKKINKNRNEIHTK